jgi:hypothetical protein
VDLPMPGSPPEQHQRSGHQPTTEHPIKFPIAAGQPLEGPFPHRLDRFRSAWAGRLPVRRPALLPPASSGACQHGPPSPSVGRGGGRLQLLHQGVPAAAAGAAAKELAGSGPRNWCRQTRSSTWPRRRQVGRRPMRRCEERWRCVNSSPLLSSSVG